MDLGCLNNKSFYCHAPDTSFNVLNLGSPRLLYYYLDQEVQAPPVLTVIFLQVKLNIHCFTTCWCFHPCSMKFLRLILI